MRSQFLHTKCWPQILLLLLLIKSYSVEEESQGSSVHTKLSMEEEEMKLMATCPDSIQAHLYMHGEGKKWTEKDKSKWGKEHERGRERTQRKGRIKILVWFWLLSISTSFALFDYDLSMILKLEETILNANWNQCKVALLCQFAKIKLIHAKTQFRRCLSSVIKMTLKWQNFKTVLGVS